MKARIWAVIIFSGFTIASPLQAGSPKLLDAVKITSFQFVGTPNLDSTFQLSLHCDEFVTATAVLTLSFPGNVVPVDQATGEIDRSETLTLTPGSSFERLYHFKAVQLGPSIVTATVTLTNPAVGYSTSDSWFLTADLSQETTTIFDDRNPGEPNPVTIQEYFDSDPLQQAPESPTTTTLTVSGKVQYSDRSVSPAITRGVPGVKVLLRFRNTASPTIWYHPVGKTSCYGIQHTH